MLLTGRGAVRQDHPKTEASIRSIAVPEFAAAMLRARIAALGPASPDRTVFSNRAGGLLRPFNVRRTFRAFLALAGLADSDISLRWYRRTGATVVARAADVDTAATSLNRTDWPDMDAVRPGRLFLACHEHQQTAPFRLFREPILWRQAPLRSSMC